MKETKNIISGENIVKTYGNGTEKSSVLSGVSLSVKEGEFVAVMGPSGSGKSTLMYAVSGMDEINSGKVMFDNMDLSAYGEEELADIRRTKMGFVFQQPTLLKNLNILDNIILPSMAGRRKNVKQLTDKARLLMKKTGIEKLENRDTMQVSGGQLQRAGICRALMSDPKIIFGDEPTGALNSNAAQEIMDIFSEINAEGTAVMLVTHDPKIAARTERILFMQDGKIDSELRLTKFDGKNLESRMEEVAGEMLRIGI